VAAPDPRRDEQAPVRLGLRSRKQWHSCPVAELDNQLELTADLVRQRLDMGDRADVPREVEHSAIFRNKEDATAAADALSALGYQVLIHRRWLRYVLEFSHVTAVDHHSAAEFTRQVVPVIERHRGTYDGWGALVEE
jgi:regulator of RNase E activity RraB